MPQTDPIQFFTPSGRPSKPNATTQRAIDRWHSAGLTPPPPQKGESQYFYATRIGNSLTNRQRGYYGENVTTERMFDKRESPAPTQAQIKNNARSPKGFGQQLTSVGKSNTGRTYSALLGIGSALSAVQNGRRR